MSNAPLSDYGDELAIVGMAGRFPGAKNIDEFWRNLRDGVESISFFSEEELLNAGIDPALLKDPHYVKAGAILEDIELFDATFFGYTPREAELMDPQQRVFLECAWEALESAGYAADTYSGRIGVYAGASVNTYLLSHLYTNADITESTNMMQMMIGNEKDHVGTRVSYKLNLRGPGISVSTACSTSLVATHLACQSLLNGECDIALVGGTAIKVPHKAGYMYYEGGIVSPDGRCRAFDEQAQGTISGSGVAAIAIKRLEDALNEGDTIYAVIKGSAINNDGSAKIGYTAPGVRGQVEVIAEAHAVAGVEPDTITYIETHGTGTALGDPIEIEALKKVFQKKTDKKGFCAIGSVKTNIGHLDVTAGLAGLIKTSLMLKHKLIAPSLHFERPNPNIDFANSPFYVNAALSPWQPGELPLRAGVSSFGIGGTNAHVILEEAPHSLAAERATRPWQLMVLSAKTETALAQARVNLATYLRQHPEVDLADVAYTLKVGRSAFEHRQAIVCRDTVDAIHVLEAGDPKRLLSMHMNDTHRSVAFLFPGQGAQYVLMGQRLYQTEPIFRAEVDKCAQMLIPHLKLDIRTVLYPDKQHIQEATLQLDQTWLTQPALFVLEYALSKLWEAWGIRPHAMIGHSIGEYVAACISGVFSLEDALQLVAARGRLMQQVAGGSMLAIPLSRSDIEQHLTALPLHTRDLLSIAAVNAPTRLVVSGPLEAIEALNQHLQTQGIDCRRLRTSHAFHSAMVEPILDEFAAQVRMIALCPPRIRYISNVTGTWITTEQATDPHYWVKHLRHEVCFADGIQTLLHESDSVLLEVGPGRTLCSFVKQQTSLSASHIVVASLPRAAEEQPDDAFLLTSLGYLWLAGIKVDWSKFYLSEQRQRVPLPTYPFERQRYWIKPGRQALNRATLGSEKKANIADWFSLPSWKRSPLPLKAITGDEQSDDQVCWLVFLDEIGLGHQLSEKLEQAGETVITVTIAEQFAKIDAGAYTLCPGKRSDYDALLHELALLGILPRYIMHCWSIYPLNEKEYYGYDHFEDVQWRGFYSLLFLIQAIGDRQFSHSLQIMALSNNLHEVVGGEASLPSRATLLGFHQVIPYEYSNITFRCLDLVIPDTGASRKQLLNQIIEDVRSGQADPVVAYRGTYRWIQGNEPLHLEAASAEQVPLREHGVYLITGGLGGVGFILAEYLAREVHARLILTGRTELPARALWERWLLSHDEQDMISRKIRQIQQLEALGAEIIVMNSDVSNEQDVQSLFDLIYKQFGVLHGVIHTAAVPGGGVIQLQQPEVVATAFAAKVKGTLLLGEALIDKPLDFLILCSSLSSILGGVGLVDYCAGNAFLDTFAFSYTARSGIRTIAINWDTWREVGMTLNAARLQKLSKVSQIESEDIKGSIKPEEGIEAFHRVLAWSPASQIIIATRDIQAVQQKYKQYVTQQGSDLDEQKMNDTDHARPNIQTPYIAPRNEHEQQVAAIWQKVLGIEEIGVEDNFLEIGGDSVMIIQIAQLIQETFQVAIPMHLIFAAPTIAGLAQTIIQRQEELITDERMAELIEKVSQMSEEEILQQLGKNVFS